MSAASLFVTPYKGLMPYEEKEADAQFFFGRESEREVALVGRLRGALAKLNPGTPAAAINLALEGVGSILDQGDAEGITARTKLENSIGKPVHVHRENGGRRNCHTPSVGLSSALERPA